MPTVLGISCSLRNARFGTGSSSLCDEIKAIDSEAALEAYLEEQVRIRADDFFDAGRKDKLPFDTIYRNLRKAKGDRGLSNSEAALVAGLWGAWRQGAEILHAGLGSYFPMTGGGQNLDELRALVLGADALLLSGPVYFGDRGSQAQEFLEFLREDPECRAHVRDRLYGGIAVGAKRNGGQETTLIYQIVDATNLNMLAVGNSAGTTSQYGGTVVAGDVGTMSRDSYGLKTSIGTGERLGSVAHLLEAARSRAVKDPVRVAVWLLQDTENHHGREQIERLCADIQAADPGVVFDIEDFTQEEIVRCIACDICPTDVGHPEEYRCIIKSEDDLFVRRHKQLLDTDAVLMAAYSPVDRSAIRTHYQRFIERTRYLRRDNYVFSDLLVAPLVLSEVGSNQNLHIRMLTSFVRHHTVLHHPLIGMMHEDRVLNWEGLVEQGVSFARNARRLTAGRLAKADETDTPVYNPLGYVISHEKHKADVASGKMQASLDSRREATIATSSRRVS